MTAEMDDREELRRWRAGPGAEAYADGVGRGTASPFRARWRRTGVPAEGVSMADDLAVRLARLEAVEAICGLKARYADICDTGYEPDRMVAVEMISPFGLGWVARRFGDG